MSPTKESLDVTPTPRSLEVGGTAGTLTFEVAKCFL